jgi:H+/gluconate symporter-like permease
LTYGGVSLFVAAFALYPFAAALFRRAGVPRRLIPGAIALGAFTFTMDALPGSPQIQNLIPTPFFHTTAWAAPRLGLFGAGLVLACGLLYLELRRRQAAARGEGYGPGPGPEEDAPQGEAAGVPVLLALLPLLLVGLGNLGLSAWLPRRYPGPFDLAAAGVAKAAPLDVSRLHALWAVQGALVLGILAVLLTALPRLRGRLGGAGVQAAVAGALVAAFNTASEYGFGGVIASLPGFAAISGWLGRAVAHPLLSAAITTTVLAGITGSASGGMSLALSAMGAQYLAAATARGIPAEVLHRVVAMASGGMDTLPHNGAVITLLLVTGLSHRQAYVDIFAMTLIKTAAVFGVIGAYALFGLR